MVFVVIFMCCVSKFVSGKIRENWTAARAIKRRKYIGERNADAILITQSIPVAEGK